MNLTCCRGFGATAFSIDATLQPFAKKHSPNRVEA